MSITFGRNLQRDRKLTRITVVFCFLFEGIHKDRATYSILINAFARTYGYRHPFVYDLLREWRQSDYYEMLPSGTIFVNLIPFSVHVAKATVW